MVEAHFPNNIQNLDQMNELMIAKLCSDSFKTLSPAEAVAETQVQAQLVCIKIIASSNYYQFGYAIRNFEHANNENPSKTTLAGLKQRTIWH